MNAALQSLIPASVIRRFSRIAWIISIVGGAVIAVAPFLPWAYSDDALDDMSVAFYPSVMQFLALGLGLVIIAFTLLDRLLPRRKNSRAPSWQKGAVAASSGALVYLALILITIALELGGLINVEAGGWIALVGAVIAFVGSRLLVPAPETTFEQLKAPAPIEILAVTVLMLASFFAIVFALDFRDGGGFVCFVAFLGVAFAILIRSGVMAWYSAVSGRHRAVLVMSAFLVAFAFPFTQGGSDTNMSIATQVIIFAATALGLNIVVGLAGLLDLGYVAFYAVGAYAYALLSTQYGLGFWTVLPLAGAFAASFGILLGFPVLRLRGDYLAIVTLGFGEIIRLVLLNWVDLTNGPAGIGTIPGPTLFGAVFAETAPAGGTTVSEMLGIPFDGIHRLIFLYYIILALALITNIFTQRMRRLPVGRAWEALREDETACKALGINPTNTKLTAFAVGAMFAGFAGSYFAAKQRFISPESFTFIESAIILAIVVLGGMGSQIGVVLAAVLLIGLPEWFRELGNYRMLAFGVAMVLIMVYRPRGLIGHREPTIRLHPVASGGSG